jgi:acyl-CoA synthetase (AMP-forming)/AMP-acid ligase II
VNLSLGDIYRRNAWLNPETTAIVFEGRRISYRALVGRAQRLGSGLHKLDVRRQDRVSMLSMNRPEFSEYYAACALCGYIAAPVNYRLAAPEMEWILKDCAPRVLIFEDQYAALIDSLRSRLDIAAFVCLGSAPDWAIPYEDVMAAEVGEGVLSPPPITTRFSIPAAPRDGRKGLSSTTLPRCGIAR